MRKNFKILLDCAEISNPSANARHFARAAVVVPRPNLCAAIYCEHLAKFKLACRKLKF
ncbi:hypothetical protein CAMGR0001_0560 [Campylobacter gracilis RM3268]|uniref:Uncharacterized protein n=1 Tax=Campylobacter gracilis RM3268 TaxID=553220 RepID=C8PHW4_9BACT|nr:hypothetical protein CAMGR0001_0560 [Campylobacter gracilis RM3268]